MRLHLLPILVLLAVLAPARAAPRQTSSPAPPDGDPRVGRPWGEVHLPTVDGRRALRLSELRGKKVLLIEFASW